jgi:hypothetical protein
MGARRPLSGLLVAVLLAVAAHPARAERSYIPIPEVITDPNEGTTIGLLGVVLFLDDQQQIQYMFAPDVRYNQTKGVFPTLRFFGYPTLTRRYSVVLGKSTTKDEDYEAEWADRGLWDGRAFLVSSFLHEKDSTERFYGLGNDTGKLQESNYTDVDTVAQATPGVWLLPHLNLSYRMRIRDYGIERGQVTSLPFIGTGRVCNDPTTESHCSPRDTADPRFRRGGDFWAHQAALTYDSRDEIDIPSRGMLALAYTEVADRRLGSTSSFVKFGAEWRRYTPLRQGNPVLALHVQADYVSGSSDLPFWEQSSLGGHRSLRGYGSHRFIDFNRSLANAELRWDVWHRKLFGVNAVLEVTPFIDTGQVFHSVSDNPVSDLHWVGGVGFRGVVRPQIVGFVDIGRGSEGNAIFTGIDYPF